MRDAGSDERATPRRGVVARPDPFPEGCVASTRRQRIRKKSIHVSLTDEEFDEFHVIRKEHGLLERELVMQAVRSYKTLASRVDVLEAKMRLLLTKEGS